MCGKKPSIKYYGVLLVLDKRIQIIKTYNKYKGRILFFWNEMWVFRRATEADKEILADMYMMDFEDNYIHALLFAIDIVDNQKNILCFYKNELAGVLCWGVHGLLENGVCEIIHLFVRPSFRRKRVGTKLVDETIIIAAEHYEERGFQIRLIYSFTKKSNLIADSFFKSIDFIRTSEISSFYPLEDAVIWMKRLRDEK